MREVEKDLKTILKKKKEIEKRKDKIIFSYEQVKTLLSFQKEDIRQHVDHYLRDRSSMNNFELQN